MIELQGKESYVKKGFLLAFADSCHRRSSIQKPATSRQMGTEWASQPIRMRLIKAAESEVLITHELIKLSSFARNALRTRSLRHRCHCSRQITGSVQQNFLLKLRNTFSGGSCSRYCNRPALLWVDLRCRGVELSSLRSHYKTYALLPGGFATHRGAGQRGRE